MTTAGLKRANYSFGLRWRRRRTRLRISTADYACSPSRMLGAGRASSAVCIYSASNVCRGGSASTPLALFVACFSRKYMRSIEKARHFRPFLFNQAAVLRRLTRMTSGCRRNNLRRLTRMTMVCPNTYPKVQHRKIKCRAALVSLHRDRSQRTRTQAGAVRATRMNAVSASLTKQHFYAPTSYQPDLSRLSKIRHLRAITTFANRISF